MAFNDLVANQMVSEADAATAGFTLNSGQSHGTSNICMTKSTATVKYHLALSNLTGYADNQLIPKSAWAAGATSSYQWEFNVEGQIRNTDACNYIDEAMYLYSTTDYLTIGTILYNESELMTEFNGGGLSRLCTSDGFVYKISTAGSITQSYFC